MESDEHSLWRSAISVNNIHFIVSKLANKTKAKNLLEMVEKEFSIIPYNVCGLLIPPKNLKILSESILQLLRRPKKTKEMGVVGQKKAIKKFNQFAMFQNYENYYAKLIQN